MTGPISDLAAARSVLENLAADPVGGQRARAAERILAELDRRADLLNAIDLDEAERLLREYAAGDRSRLGRALALLLTEYDRRGPNPSVQPTPLSARKATP